MSRRFLYEHHRYGYGETAEKTENVLFPFYHITLHIGLLHRDLHADLHDEFSSQPNKNI